jgi:RimJ/RimL family protein N-acetyltransferase
MSFGLIRSMGKISPFTFKAKDGTEVTLRTPGAGEGGKLLKAMRQIIAETHETLILLPEEFTLTEEQEEKFIQRHYQGHKNVIIVAEVNGEIIGMLDLATAPRYRINHYGEFGMTIAKQYQGLGIGKEILKTLIKWAKEVAQLEAIRLRVHANNKPARAVYEAVGFKEEGRQLKAIKKGEGKYEDVLLMALVIS